MINEKIKLNENAYIETYLLDNSQEYNTDKKKPVVIVCPGGAYLFTSDREAEPFALKFNSVGMHSIVLRYTTEDKVSNVPQNALYELAQTIILVRKNAEKWFIDQDKITICGFSAGGNLCANMSVHWSDEELARKFNVDSEMLKPNTCILGYPAITLDVKDSNEPEHMPPEKWAKLCKQSQNVRFFGMENPVEEYCKKVSILEHVTRKVPPTFIWHTAEDVLVSVNNSLEYARALSKNGVPFDLHIFEEGEHGLALCDRTTARKASHFNPTVKVWFDLAMNWLEKYIKE